MNTLFNKTQNILKGRVKLNKLLSFKNFSTLNPNAITGVNKIQIQGEVNTF